MAEVIDMAGRRKPPATTAPQTSSGAPWTTQQLAVMSKDGQFKTATGGATRVLIGPSFLVGFRLPCHPDQPLPIIANDWEDETPPPRYA